MEAQPNPLATGRPVFVVDGNRTPFLRARGKPGPSMHPTLPFRQDGPCSIVNHFQRR